MNSKSRPNTSGRLAGKRVLFYAKGSKLGSAIVTSRGIAQIDRNTELGQTVPKIVHGSHVSVRTAGRRRDPPRHLLTIHATLPSADRPLPPVGGQPEPPAPPADERRLPTP